MSDDFEIGRFANGDLGYLLSKRQLDEYLWLRKQVEILWDALDDRASCCEWCKDDILKAMKQAEDAGK